MRSELRGEISKLLDSDWISESLGLIDKEKFRNRYNAYLEQGSQDGRFSTKDIFPAIALELWARRFASYIGSYVAVVFLLPSLL